MDAIRRRTEAAENSGFGSCEGGYLTTAAEEELRQRQKKHAKKRKSFEEEEESEEVEVVDSQEISSRSFFMKLEVVEDCSKKRKKEVKASAQDELDQVFIEARKAAMSNWGKDVCVCGKKHAGCRWWAVRRLRKMGSRELWWSR